MFGFIFIEFMVLSTTSIVDERVNVNTYCLGLGLIDLHAKSFQIYEELKKSQC